ncbi:MAG: hypothetical protein KBT76_15375 [Sulfitobacter litoralis]|nr:hypothetical protein [Sulfitobacter litoralis]
MRHDPQVEVVCDKCGDIAFWEPQYVYSDWSGTSGHFDTTDSAFSGWCRSEEWSEDGDKTYCPDCSDTGE